MVVSDLLLTPEATPTTSAVTTEVARALDTWDGPGILIIAGNLFDLSGSSIRAGRRPSRSLEAHPALNQALTRFLTSRRTAGHPPDRHPRARVRHRPGHASSAMAAKGVEPAGPVDLHLHTATGVRVVRVEPGEHAYAAGCSGPETEFDPAADAKPGVIGPSSAGRGWRSLVAQSNRDATWLIGLNRLSDPSALSRFVVSRTLYRRLGRYAWWLLVPFVVAGLLRVAVTPWVMDHLGIGTAGPRHPSRPPGGPRRPDRHRPVGGAGGPRRAGPRTGTAEPAYVVDPRRRSPGGGAGRRPRPTTRPATRAAGSSGAATPG